MKSIRDHIIPVLVIFNAILAGTIFQFFFHCLEFLLILILSIEISVYKLSKYEWGLLAIFVFAQIGSFLINDIDIAVLNAKQFGLAILSVIYFKRNSTKSFYLNGSMIVCSLLVFFEFLTGHLPINISPILGVMKDSAGSRPLGLFLNFHLTSFALAVFFIGYTELRKVFFLDYLLMYFISVKTNAIAYLGQRIFSFLQKRISFFNSGRTIFLLFLLLGIGVVMYLPNILEVFQNIDYGYNSAYVILYQLVDPKSYLTAIHLFPQDVVLYLQTEGLFDFPEVGFVDHGSELAIISLMVQGGFVLCYAYLFYLFSNYSKYRLFIFISLFHYSYILNPLIIYIMSVYQFNSKKSGE